jgi:hypothetical protein
MIIFVRHKAKQKLKNGTIAGLDKNLKGRYKMNIELLTIYNSRGKKGYSLKIYKVFDDTLICHLHLSTKREVSKKINEYLKKYYD